MVYPVCSDKEREKTRDKLKYRTNFQEQNNSLLDKLFIWENDKKDKKQK